VLEALKIGNEYINKGGERRKESTMGCDLVHEERKIIHKQKMCVRE
jgi:hypothetical protein